MRKHRQMRRGFGKRRTPVRRWLSGEDDPPFEERELEIAAGADERDVAASEAAT